VSDGIVIIMMMMTRSKTFIILCIYYIFIGIEFEMIKASNYIECNEFSEFYFMEHQQQNNSEVENKCTFSLITLDDDKRDEINLNSPLRKPKDSNFFVDFSNRIEVVEFIESILKRIPNIVFKSFVNLKTLKCDDVGLVTLKDTKFGLSLNLEHVSLMRNQLRSLGSSIFIQNQNIEFLDFSINKIDDIKRSSFYGLRRLKKLFLNENNISILPSQDIFDDLVSLEEIGLSRNRIKVIQAKLFSNCGNLSYIYLDRNLIESVHDDFVKNHTELHFIELSNNQLTQLNLTISSSALYANHNQLKSVRFNSVGYISFYNNSLHELKADDPNGVISLNISTNKFTYESLSIVFSEMKMVKSLDLSFNNLGKIEVSTFLNMSALQILNLQSTNIKDIPYGLFTHQTELDQLDISYCNLASSFDFRKLTSLKNLTTLFIEGNKISSIYGFENLKSHLPSLKLFGFSDNQWSCPFLSSMTAFLNKHEIESFHLIVEKKKSNVDGVACYNDNETTTINDGNKSQSHDVIVRHHQLPSLIDKQLMNFTHALEKVFPLQIEKFVTRDELISELSELKSLIISLQHQNLNQNNSINNERIKKLNDKFDDIKLTLSQHYDESHKNNENTIFDQFIRIMIIITFSIACGFTFIYFKRKMKLKRLQSQEIAMRHSHSVAETINEYLL
jgi:Leucine-rich repeat (LRR) protein